MPEQFLDDTEIHPGLQEVSCVRMTQRLPILLMN
jgi:hypothetical protein